MSFFDHVREILYFFVRMAEISDFFDGEWRKFRIFLCSCPILGSPLLSGEGEGVVISVGYGAGDVLALRNRMTAKN